MTPRCLFKATASRFCLPPLAGRIFTWFLSACTSWRLPPVRWSLLHHVGFCPACLRFSSPILTDRHRHTASQEIYRRQQPQKASFHVDVGKSRLASCTHFSRLRSRKAADVYRPALRLQTCLLSGFFQEKKGQRRVVVFFISAFNWICSTFVFSLSFCPSVLQHALCTPGILRRQDGKLHAVQLLAPTHSNLSPKTGRRSGRVCSPVSSIVVHLMHPKRLCEWYQHRNWWALNKKTHLLLLVVAFCFYFFPDPVRTNWRLQSVSVYEFHLTEAAAFLFIALYDQQTF